MEHILLSEVLLLRGRMALHLLDLESCLGSKVIKYQASLREAVVLLAYLILAAFSYLLLEEYAGFIIH
jgi:hypothetical protein